MSWMKSTAAAITLAVLIGFSAAPYPILAQPFPTQITQAIANLTSGVTPFTNEGVVASGYINWGTARSSSGYGLRDSAGVIQVKNSGGTWVAINATSTTPAPATATFITQTPNSTLVNEQALSTLATALLVNTTSTGVLTAYPGATCVSGFLRILGGDGTGTCQSVSLTADVVSALPIANGGTNLTGYAQGDVIYASALNTLASLGKSASATRYLSNTGTSNNPAWAQVDLTTGVTGILPVANGGGGIGTGTSGGVLGYTSTTTLASSVLLTMNALVLGGGAGATPTPLASLGTTTTLLHGNAAGAPTWSAVDLINDTTGTVTAARGGTGQSSYAVGDLLYASGAAALSKLADVAAGSFLRSGGVTTAPAWSTTTLPNSSVQGDIMFANGTNTYGNLTAVATGSYLRSAGVTTNPVWSTITLPNAGTQGDLMTATGANAYGNVSDVATGSVLVSGGVATVPAYSATPTVTTVTATYYNSLASTTLVSAATITPTRTIHHVSGSAAVATITVPAGCTPTCVIYLVPDGTWTWTTGGNVSIAGSAVVNKVLIMVWDGTKWNPSYLA